VARWSDTSRGWLDLKSLLEAFISHRREVVTRRTVYELKKARERGHILEAWRLASNVDEVIEPHQESRVGGREAGLMFVRGVRPRKESNRKKSGRAVPARGSRQQFGLKEDGYHLSDEQARTSRACACSG